MGRESPSDSRKAFTAMFRGRLGEKRFARALKIFQWYSPHLSGDVTEILNWALEKKSWPLFGRVMKKLENHWWHHLSWLHPKCRTRNKDLGIANIGPNQNERFFQNLERLIARE